MGGGGLFFFSIDLGRKLYHLQHKLTRSSVLSDLSENLGLYYLPGLDIAVMGPDPADTKTYNFTDMSNHNNFKKAMYVSKFT